MLPHGVTAFAQIDPPLNFELNFNVMHGPVVAPIALTPVGNVQMYEIIPGDGFVTQ